MGLKDYSELNEIQLDALCEIGNIGSGNAASALSSMLDKPVHITVPRIRILDYDSVVAALGGEEELLVGLLFSLSGEVTGMIMFLLQKGFANMLLSDLTGADFGDGSELDEYGLSAMREVGNIMAASYVNAIGALTDMEISISVPSLCIDMAGAILSVPAIYYANISDKIIMIEDEFSGQTEHGASQVLLIPEVQSLEQIMINLGLGE